MNIYLTGSTGGIGSAIKEALGEHNFINDNKEIDWLIVAHGVIDEVQVLHHFTVNTVLPIQLTQSLFHRIRHGVIYISSTAGIRGNTQFPVYSAAKAAINSYAQTMAKKHLELQFYALCPGPTNTKMWRELKMNGKAQEPIEVAKAVKRILDGEFKSGDIITVRDGEVTV